MLLVELERRRERRVENLDLVRQHLDLARGELRIDGARRPAPDLAAHPQDKLVADALGAGKRIRPVRIADHLHEPLAIAQIDEDDAAMIAAAMSPAAEGHRLADERGSELAAVVGSHARIV